MSHIDPGQGAPEAAAPPAAGDREGLSVARRSQWRMFRQRFLAHRLAMISLFVLTVIIILALNAERLTPYAYDQMVLANADLPPTFQDRHFFGTDRLGRDYFSRVIFGTRTTVLVALLVATLSTAVGTAIGALAGYFGGWLDNLLMRVTDLVIVLPGLAVLMILVAFVGEGSPIRVAFILSALMWTLIARIVRAQFLSLRKREFVEAALLAGASVPRIIVRHMLPNAMGPIIVNATLTIATAILIESALSFLGFGVQPPVPALGQLIASGRATMMTHWWLVTLPGLMIVTICLAVNFIGDGLRDALDARQQIKG